jgi:hypothetical protein
MKEEIGCDWCKHHRTIRRWVVDIIGNNRIKRIAIYYWHRTLMGPWTLEASENFGISISDTSPRAFTGTTGADRWLQCFAGLICELIDV